MVGIAGGLALITSGCGHTDASTDKSKQTPPSQERAAKSDEVAQIAGDIKDSLMELREKVVAGKPFALDVAIGQCVAWPGRKGIAVVHNPAVYSYNPGKSKLDFIPFVGSGNGKTVVMNGPFATFRDGEPYLGNMNAALPTNGHLFLASVIGIYTPTQNDEMAPPQTAWLEGPAGLRVAETTSVSVEELATVFGGDCENIDTTQLEPV